MPQVKETIKIFGIHRHLLYQPKIRKFYHKQNGAIRGKEEALILIKAAENPDFFSTDNRVKKFATIYARQPDVVLAFMGIVRKILSSWDVTKAGTVIRFLCDNQSAQTEDRQMAYDDKGNPVTVTITNKLNDTKKTISIPPAATADEIRSYATGKFVPISGLIDKELAIVLDVDADSVKKARQAITEMSTEMEYWESPEVVHYQKTGIVTPALKKRWEERRKGKK